jgi:glycosyltransferase involved in cell wall biosynthesis
MDVFATASYFETLGLSTLEAMGCGLPPVVYPRGGSLDLVHDSRGFMAKSAEEFRRIFVHLRDIQGTHTFEQMRGACIQYAHQFTAQRMTKHLVNLYTMV